MDLRYISDMKKNSYYTFIILDETVKEKILAVMQHGSSKTQSLDFFRTTIGLYYLSKIMVENELDFKTIDKEFNVFIYRTIGHGHSITSILQYLSGKKVLWTLNSPTFIATFLDYFSDIPFKHIPLLLTINLSVSKKISAIPTDGPVQDWILKQTTQEQIDDKNG